MSGVYALSEIYDLQMGKTPSRDNLKYWENGNYEWISIADLTKYGEYTGDSKEKITQKAIEESGIRVIPSHTLIMSFKLSIGKVAITSRDCFSNEAIMAFIDKGVIKIIPEYAYYLFLAQDWDKGTNRAVMGATLNKATLSKYQVYIHDEDVQKEIVYKLNKITNAIKYRRCQIEKIDDLVKSQFIEMFGDPVVNEKRWAIGKLSDVAELKIGPFGSLLHKEDYVVGGHPLINPSHIVGGKIEPDVTLSLSDEKYNELSAYHLKQDDIVLGRRGEMGRCAVVYDEGLFCGTGCMIVRPSGKVLSYFLQSVLSSPSMKKLIEERAVGVTMANLNVPIVANLPIPMYPMEKQRDYIRVLQQTDKSKEVYELEVAA